MPINICEYCKKEFKVRGIKRANVAKFCSIKCRDISRSYVVVEGVKINSLTLIKEVEPEIQFCRGSAMNIRRVMCKCDCGNITITRLFNFRNGFTKSCGCLTIKQSEINIGPRLHGLSKHPLYIVWSNMIDRCYDKNCKQYSDYGYRGVSVCKEWLSDFKIFYDWAILSGWKKGLQLDKDIKGNGLLYSPEMCLFVTVRENANNKRRSRRILLNGVYYSVSEVSEMYGIPYSRAYVRFKDKMVYKKDIHGS